MTTITISPDGERFKVKIEQPGMTLVHWFDLEELALLKVAAERLRLRGRGELVTVINEVKDVQATTANL